MADQWLNKNRSGGLDPASLVGLSESVDYLDRMIAGGARSQRQFLPSGPSRQGGPLGGGGGNQNKNRKSKQYQAKNDKKPFQNNSPVVNIDDVNWLADRRRKFPKVGGSEPSNSTNGAESSEKPMGPKLSPPLKSPPAKDTQSKLGNTTNNLAIPKRRKTLFEKLVEMDQQPNQ